MDTIPDRHANRRVVVVGGGVFGATAAVELATRGWQVTVLDPAPLPAAGASSTDVSKVVRSDYGSDVFYHDLGEASIDGWHRWNRDWPVARYHEDGFILLAGRPMQPGGYEFETRRVLEDRGRRPVALSSPEVKSRLEHVAPDAAQHGYFNPRAGWAESGAVVSQLLELAAALGVDFIQDGMLELASDGSIVSGVVTTSGRLVPGDRVVLAAGAWTPRLAPWLQSHLWPVAQPVVHLSVENPDEFRGERFVPWAYDISSTGWYGFPALDNGHLKIGHHGPGNRLDPDERGTVDSDHDERLRAFLGAVFPTLLDAPIVHRRVCMYCDSFDGDLLIGEAPDRDGVIIATGGSGHGFKFAPMLGGIIADAVERRTNPWESRLGWREATQHRTEEARYSDRSREDRP